MFHKSDITTKLYAAIILQFVLLGTTGCIGIGGHVGMRTRFKDSEAAENLATEKNEKSNEVAVKEETSENVYAGMGANWVGDRYGAGPGYMYYGLKWEMLFGDGDTMNVLMPYAAMSTNKSYTMDWASENKEIGYGGTFGVGIETGKRGSGFHTELCGGAFAAVHMMICNHLSTQDGGWYGLDFNANIPALATFVDSVDIGTSAIAAPAP